MFHVIKKVKLQQGGIQQLLGQNFAICFVVFFINRKPKSTSWELNNPPSIFPYVALAAAAACKTSQCCHHINCMLKKHASVDISAIY